MLTLLFVLSPFALLGMIAIAFVFYDNGGVIRRPIKKETAEDRVKRYGYDPESKMVQVFQRRAGIKNTRGKFDLRYM